MKQKELDNVIEQNLEIAFTYFKKVNETNGIEDNGDTSRILALVEELNNE